MKIGKSDAGASEVSFIECSIHKNFGMRYEREWDERDMKSAFTKIDHAGSNANNHF